MKERKSRVIVITGGSAGVGRAIAHEFARRGDKVGLIARGEEKLDSAVLEMQQLGAEALACSADVSDEEALEQAAQKIEEAFGPIDVWINNAMVSVLGPVKRLSSREIKRVTDVTYHGSVNGVLVALRRFLPRNEGHIIQIGSALAYQSIPLQSAYCGAKHAIHGFIESLRIELMHDKSKVNLSEVQLPAVNTPQFEWLRNYMPEHPMPVPPIFQPEVIADAVAYVVDNPRREFWVGGPAVKAILGSKFAPRVAAWYLSKKGYEGQQTESKEVTHNDYLWKPVPKDFGARGTFGNQAKDYSVQLWLNKNRSLVGIGTFVLSGLGVLLKRRVF